MGSSSLLGFGDTDERRTQDSTPTQLLMSISLTIIRLWVRALRQPIVILSKALYHNYRIITPLYPGAAQTDHDDNTFLVAVLVKTNSATSYHASVDK